MALAPKFRNWLRTLGAPEDPVATDTSSEWSAISLLKAIYSKITDGTLASGIAGAADSQIRTAAASASALGGVASKRAAASAAAAAASATIVQSGIGFLAGAIAQCAHFMRLTRASRVAAATSATNAATSETNASTSASTASSMADAATLHAYFAAGTAIFGQRAKKDRVAAAASAAAAAASAAGVPSAESLILPTQIFS